MKKVPISQAFQFKKFSSTPELELFANFELLHAMEMVPPTSKFQAVVTFNADKDENGKETPFFFCDVLVMESKYHLALHAVACAPEAKTAIQHAMASICEQLAAWKSTSMGIEYEPNEIEILAKVPSYVRVWSTH